MNLRVHYLYFLIMFFNYGFLILGKNFLHIPRVYVMPGAMGEKLMIQREQQM